MMNEFSSEAWYRRRDGKQVHITPSIWHLNKVIVETNSEVYFEDRSKVPELYLRGKQLVTPEKGTWYFIKSIKEPMVVVDVLPGVSKHMQPVVDPVVLLASSERGVITLDYPAFSRNAVPYLSKGDSEYDTHSKKSTDESGEQTSTARLRAKI